MSHAYPTSSADCHLNSLQILQYTGVYEAKHPQHKHVKYTKETEGNKGCSQDQAFLATIHPQTLLLRCKNENRSAGLFKQAPYHKDKQSSCDKGALWYICEKWAMFIQLAQ